MEHYYTMKSSALVAQAKIPLTVLPTAEAVFASMAAQMIEIIEANNAKGEPTLLIVPVGPVGQYPYFIAEVNKRRISLADVWFVSMDEYLGKDNALIPYDHRLSFRRHMDEKVYSLIDPALVMDRSQRIVPNPLDLDAVDRAIRRVGKVDACFGGVGINGHLAFNEPEDVPVSEFASRSTRIQVISCQTRTVNSIADLGGAVEQMPTHCVTIGMKQILMAKTIRLGCFRDWHKAVVRRAVCEKPSALFPVSLLQNHPDAMITVPEAVAQPAW